MCIGQCGGFFDGEALEAHGVAGLELAKLPAFGFDDDGGADEAAEAGAVGAEQDRHVAGEIQRADGVGVVVQVGRMQAGFTAVLTRPLRLRADEAHAGAVRVVMHLPRREENHLDVFVREKIRRAVRAVEHAERPGVGEFVEAGDW